MGERRTVDVGALLQETALEVKLAGETYVLTDMPVSAAIRAAAGGEDSGPDRDLQFLKDVLGATCGEDTERRTKLEADVEKLGQRARQALVLSLLDFSDASDLVDKLPLKPRVKEAVKAGLDTSPTT